jgi:hypothetical protein
VILKKRAELLYSFCAICCTCLALGVFATAQQGLGNPSDRDLIPLLQQVQANRRSNGVIVRHYVSDELTHTVAWNKSGKRIRDETERGESVFAADAWYYRIVERNGKPLSAERQLSLQKHLDVESDLRKKFDFGFDLRDANPRNSVYSALPICCLAELLENRIVGHEQIEGHDTLVVESTPKANTNWGSPENRTALDWKETTWIDLNDLMPVRIEVELLNDKSFLLKGSTELREYVKMQFQTSTGGESKETVWLMQTKKDHSNLKFLWKYLTQSFDDTSYNFRRFTADVHVLADSAAAPSNQSSGAKP